MSRPRRRRAWWRLRVGVPAFPAPAFPRSVYIIDAALCFLATAGIQFSIRVFWEVLLPNAKERGNSKAILIYGAGEAGLMLGREIRSNTRLKTRIAGFL